MKPSQFLESLWGHSDGHILIWRLDGRRSTWIKSVDDADGFEGYSDVYHGLAKSDQPRGMYERVDNDSAYAIPGLWCDFDYGTDNHERRNLPPTEADLAELISFIDPEPTIVVSSGNGRHCYWLFDKPLIIDKTDLAANLVEVWQSHIKHLASEHGWHVDSTFDLARVLRLPSTFNAKNPDDLKPVNVIKDDGPRYPADWWVNRLIHARPMRAKPEIASDVTANPEATPGDWFEHLLDAIPDMRATFEHRRKIADGSMSAYDLSLASYAVRANRSDQEIADIIVYHRRLRGDANDIEKGNRADYIQRTISKARNGEPYQVDVVKHEDITELPVDDLFDKIGAGGISRIVQIMDDEDNPGIFRMQLQDGGHLDIEANVVLSEAAWRGAVLKATNRLVSRLPKGTWDSFAERIADSIVRLYPGDDGHPKYRYEVDETRDWVRDYIDMNESKNTEIDADEAQLLGKRRVPFKHRDQVYFFTDHFANWVYANRSQRISLIDAAQRLRSINLVQRRPRIFDKQIRAWQFEARNVDF